MEKRLRWLLTNIVVVKTVKKNTPSSQVPTFFLSDFIQI